MLTDKAMRDREWNSFPALRQAFEDKRIPDVYFGLSSVSDNMFASLHRLLKISVLVREYEKNVRHLAQTVSHYEIYSDLRRLEEDLIRASSLFTNFAKEVGNVCRALDGSRGSSIE